MYFLHIKNIAKWMLGTDNVKDVINPNPVFNDAFAISEKDIDIAIILADDVINN